MDVSEQQLEKRLEVGSWMADGKRERKDMKGNEICDRSSFCPHLMDKMWAISSQSQSYVLKVSQRTSSTHLLSLLRGKKGNLVFFRAACLINNT